MAEREDRIRLQVKVDPEVADKIDELASRLKFNRQEFLERLITFGISDNAWIIKLVTSEFLEPVRDWGQKLAKKKKHRDI